MIPVFDLGRQNKKLKKELHLAIDEVVKSGSFILGRKVKEFEKEFARYIGVKYAVGVASGTDALFLSLQSIGVKEGDEVIVPANAYPTAFAVTAIGAIPKLVDIDPLAYNLNPSVVANAVTKRTKAIIIVYLYGQPTDIISMYRIIDTSSRKIYIIEDCAQAHGAQIKVQKSISSGQLPSVSNKQPITDNRQPNTFWKKVGSIGDIGCFSFYPTKNLGCFGDGGMVVTNNENIYRKIKLLRMYGEKERYKSVILGRNSRLDELQAAILLVKLKYLDSWNKRRREIASKYKLQINNYQLDQNSQIIPPHEMQNTKHVYHLFVIRAKKRNKLKAFLQKKGIGIAIHYPKPIHFQQSFQYLGYRKGDFVQSEKASDEILSLPMFPELENKEVEKVVREISNFF